jgi:hypothetical protein
MPVAKKVFKKGKARPDEVGANKWPPLGEESFNEYLLAAVRSELASVRKREKVLTDLRKALRLLGRASVVPAPAKALNYAQGSVHQSKESERKRMRKLSHPNDAMIEPALRQTGGNAIAAARILGCSGNWVRAHIRSERAKGRELGRCGAGRRESDARSNLEPEFNEIEIAISISDAEIASAPPYQPTEAELMLNAVFEEFVADLLE